MTLNLLFDISTKISSVTNESRSFSKMQSKVDKMPPILQPPCLLRRHLIKCLWLGVAEVDVDELTEHKLREPVSAIKFQSSNKPANKKCNTIVSEGYLFVSWLITAGDLHA